jgi:hypothetical protein
VRKRSYVIADDSELEFWASEIVRVRDAIHMLKRREAWTRERILDLLGEPKTIRSGRFEIQLIEASIEPRVVEGRQQLRLEVRELK